MKNENTKGLQLALNAMRAMVRNMKAEGAPQDAIEPVQDSCKMIARELAKRRQQKK